MSAPVEAHLPTSVFDFCTVMGLEHGVEHRKNISKEIKQIGEDPIVSVVSMCQERNGLSFTVKLLGLEDRLIYQAKHHFENRLWQGVVVMDENQRISKAQAEGIGEGRSALSESKSSLLIDFIRQYHFN